MGNSSRVRAGRCRATPSAPARTFFLTLIDGPVSSRLTRDKLRRANEILKVANALFAQAEPDRRFKS
jgi:hypothetical protein